MIPPQEFSVGDSARVGLTLQSSLSGCQLRMWYSLSDSQKGSIRISKRSAAGAQPNVLATITTPSSNWVRADVNVGAEPYPYQILIEGVAGPSRDGYLAIDDFSFTPDCKVNENVVLPTVATSSTTRLSSTVSNVGPQTIPTVPTQNPVTPGGSSTTSSTGTNQPGGSTTKKPEDAKPEKSNNGKIQFLMSLVVDLLLTLILCSKKERRLHWE